MSKITKKQRVLTALENHGSISPWYAFNNLGETRLAATISSLIKDGYKITSKTETGKNRFGDTIRFSRYFLTSKP
jgi:hypothetical protein